MKYFSIRFWLFIQGLALGLWLLAPGAVPVAALAENPAPGKSSGRHQAGLSDIVIKTDHGLYPFHVEVAATEAARSRGLMFRDALAADGGMIFISERPDLVAMWMKNTLIPLDMLFIDGRGVIVNIAKNTRPQSLDIIRSAGPVLAVLEIAGGTADRLGIKAGDRVRSHFFSGK